MGTSARRIIAKSIVSDLEWAQSDAPRPHKAPDMLGNLRGFFCCEGNVLFLHVSFCVLTGLGVMSVCGLVKNTCIIRFQMIL